MAHLLLVDDSPTIRRMLKVALAPLGFEMLEAASGLEAIEQLAVAPVQLMVLDLNMPDMHGLDVLKFVRANHAYRDLPVVVLTTRGDETSRDAAVHAGASAYMTKPFSPVALASRAQQLLDPISHP